MKYNFAAPVVELVPDGKILQLVFDNLLPNQISKEKKSVKAIELSAQEIPILTNC